MKTKLLTSLILTALAMPTVAQTITDRFEFGDAYKAALSIPKEFSYGGVPYLMLYDGNDRNTIQVYDENLNVAKRIAMKEELPFNYQLTYQDQVREVTAVNETQKSETSHYESYEAFVQQERMTDPTFDESCLIITDMGDGTRKIKVDYSRSRYMSNEQMYYAYSYFGMQYPKVYFIDNGSGVTCYRVTYTVQYSDWKTAGTRVVDCSEEQRRIQLCNINLNQGDGRTESYFDVSQTLFNDDASFEYLMPKFKLSTHGNIGGSNTIISGDDDEQIITSQSTVISDQKNLALAGFQVLSENGNVVSDITFDSDFEGTLIIGHAFVITISENVYLAFDGYTSESRATIFYKVDRKNPSAIQKVKVAPSTMSLSPTIVRGGSTINVTFDDANEKGSDIVVVSASGAAVKSYHVPAGQTSAQIQANTSAGMYCVSRLQKNKVSETKKIIVK